MKSRIESSIVVGSPIAVSRSARIRFESGSESTSTPSQSKITRSYAIGRRTLEAVRSLTDPWELGGIRIPNRVVLAPLAGIGNWFVRLQAKRYGAGLARLARWSRASRSTTRTAARSTSCSSSTRASARRRAGGDAALRPGPGRHARRRRARGRGGRRPDRPQHGLPRPEGLQDRRGRRAAQGPRHRRRGRARRAPRAPACPSPSSCAPRASTSPAGSSRRPAWPASPSTRARSRCATRAARTTTSRPSSSQALPVPVIVSGGMREAEHVRWAFEYTGAEAIMLARGSLGNPWLFEQVLGTREGEPAPRRGAREWAWVVDRAEEHLGRNDRQLAIEIAGRLRTQLHFLLLRNCARAEREAGWQQRRNHRRPEKAEPWITLHAHNPPSHKPLLRKPLRGQEMFQTRTRC